MRNKKIDRDEICSECGVKRGEKMNYSQQSPKQFSVQGIKRRSLTKERRSQLPIAFSFVDTIKLKEDKK